MYTWSIVKASERTLLDPYRPSQDEDVKEAEEIAADLEVVKRDQAKLTKHVRVHSPRLYS